MNIKRLLPSLLILSIAACSAQGSDGARAENEPQITSTELAGDTSVRMIWSGDATAGFRVFRRSQDESYYVNPLATVQGHEFTFDGLEAGKSYYFGVQALSDDAKLHSKIVYAPLFEVPAATAPEPEPEPEPQPEPEPEPAIAVSDAAANYAYVRIRCNFPAELPTTAEHGICYGSSVNPKADGQRIAGPNLPSSRSALQVIPCTLLTPGQSFHFRAYAKFGGEYVYSRDIELEIPAQPQAVSFEWTQMSGFDIPEAIKVYQTSTTLNGRKLNAWYAIADCSGDVELRVLNPSRAATVDKQMEAAGEDCYVLVNGGFFYNGHIGSLVCDGKLSGEIYGSMGDIRSGYPETDKWYECNRSVVGVDAAGKPGAWWWRVRSGNAYYYDTPMPTVKGEAQYYWSSYTGDAKTWNPVNAISAGPMVLYDGKVIVEYTKNDSQPSQYGNFWYSNYEMLAYDIFDQDQRPDRTAIGYTADGKVVLFICDGRLPGESLGADLAELGQIMKGLGCVSAMNLDGGGSTGMMVRDTHLNNWYQNGRMEYRAVYTTVGFFRKK